MRKKTRSEQIAKDAVIEQRNPLMSGNNINHILVHGAQIAFSKLRRANSHNARTFYFAQIGVYLEVSLSSGSGISKDSREQLGEIHQQALISLMAANKLERQQALD